MTTIAYVRWRDCTKFGSVQMRPKKARSRKLMLIESAGLLIAADADAVTLALDFCDRFDYRDVQKIPRENIVSLRVVKAGRMRRRKAAGR